MSNQPDDRGAVETNPDTEDDGGRRDNLLTRPTSGWSSLTNGGELMFFRDTQLKSGSVDTLAALQWPVSQGWWRRPISNSAELRRRGLLHQRSDTFALSGLTFNLSYQTLLRVRRPAA